MKKVGVGLYGTAGHQIQEKLLNHPMARWVAAAEFLDVPEDVKLHDSLEGLVADPGVDVVSFCSPRRDEQGGHILTALAAGKHVYAEKPCCTDERTLDKILESAERSGKVVHEMAATAFEQPYCTLRELILAGEIGDVLQILSQKSYPWTDWRPDDEGMDGGLALQAGVYHARFMEHVAGVRIADLRIEESCLGNDHPNSDCRRAVSFLARLENGGLASAVSNYACPEPPAWGNWGYDVLRVFGTRGFVEAVNGGESGRLVRERRPPLNLDFTPGSASFLDGFFQEVLTGKPVSPLTLEEELRPTRWVIRAKENLRKRTLEKGDSDAAS